MKLHPPNDPGEFEAVLFDANNVRHRVVSLRAVVTPTPGALSTDKREHVIGAPFRYAPRNGPTGSTATAGWVCSRKGKTIPADRRAGPVVLSSSFETKPMARPRDQSIGVSRAASSFFSTLPTPLLGRSSIKRISRGNL